LIWFSVDPPAMTVPQNQAARPEGPGRGVFGGLTGRQAVATLFVAVALGGLGSAGELVLDWRSRRVEVVSNTRQVLTMMRGAAEEAAYQLDSKLSRQVAEGLLSIDAVTKVTLTDDYGGVLATAARTDDRPQGAVAAWLFGDVTRHVVALTRGGADARPLGRLEAVLSADRLAESFFARAWVNAGSGLLRALAICGVVAALFAWMVTRPIVRLGQDVARVDPKEPARRPITIPKGRENDEIGDLAAALNALLTAFQHSLSERDKALAENLRLGAEIDISRRLQRMVLPTQAELDAVPGLDVAAFMEPAAEVGGDYYDVLRGADGRVRIGIGDVTGHGLESGVVMLMTQSAVRSLATREASADDGMLNALNRMMFDNLKRMGSDRNLTLALIEYEPFPPDAPGTAGKLRITGQHESVLVARADGRLEIIDTLELGMPLGLVDDISGFIGVTETDLHTGDVVMLYTDGITEAADPAHRLFGMEQLCETLVAARAGTAEDIKQAVLAAVDRHIGLQPIWDDLTLVVMKQR
jgi:phosphoserine phosphatase RsbU/P